MENNVINNTINNEPVKRGRGRPKKESPPVVKPEKKPNGRPRKYEEGAIAHYYKKITVNRKRYNELLEIEKKYIELLQKNNN